MASPFATGFATGFFNSRTKQIEQEEDRRAKLEDQIRLLQVQSLGKQQERYEEINSAVTEIGNNLANDNVEAAVAKAVEARFGGITAKNFKDIFGNERQASMDEGGRFSEEVRTRLAESLGTMVNQWRADTKDLDFTADTAEVLTSKLLSHKKKFDGVGDVVTDVLGIKDHTQTFQSPMKGTMKMFRTPTADLKYPTEERTEEAKPSKRLVTKTRQDGTKVAVMVHFDSETGDPIREGREVIVEPNDNSKVISEREETVLIGTVQSLLAEATEDDSDFWDDFVYKNYGDTNEPQKLAPVYEMEFYRSRAQEPRAPVQLHAEKAFRNFMAFKDLGLLTTTKEGTLLGIIPKEETQVTGSNVNRFYQDSTYRRTIALDTRQALTSGDVEMTNDQKRRIKFLFTQFPDLDDLGAQQ